MLVIGELINSTRKGIKEALQEKDASRIRHLARKQLDAGADVLDVNTATSRDQEIDDMEWAIGIIHEEAGGDVRLAIDSPKPEAVEHGLGKCRARPLVNSITNDPKTSEPLLPLVKEHDADVIGLTMGKKGMPKTVEERVAEAGHLIESVDKAGVALERLYIDPLVMTIGSNQEQAVAVLETVRTIKKRWGQDGVKTSVGLSNVSYGLPRRTAINQAFLAMLLQVGLDAAIVDPTDPRMMEISKACDALLGSDDHCLGYIKYQRQRAL